MVELSLGSFLICDQSYTDGTQGFDVFPDFVDDEEGKDIPNDCERLSWNIVDVNSYFPPLILQYNSTVPVDSERK